MIWVYVTHRFTWLWPSSSSSAPVSAIIEPGPDAKVYTGPSYYTRMTIGTDIESISNRREKAQREDM
jgi:hypothetical protein